MQTEENHDLRQLAYMLCYTARKFLSATSGWEKRAPEHRSACSSGHISPWMKRNRIMILSRILSSSSSVASLLPARNFESTCLAERAKIPIKKPLWGQSRRDTAGSHTQGPGYHLTPIPQERKTNKKKPQTALFNLPVTTGHSGTFPKHHQCRIRSKWTF